MKSRDLLVVPALAAIITACGGKVIFDTSSGATGGASSTSTSTVFGTQSTGVTSTHATSVTSFVGSTNVGTTNGVVSSVGATSSNVSSGDVMPTCDTGQPGTTSDPVCNACVQCAESAVCPAQVQKLMQDADAQAFIACVNACMPMSNACQQQCETQHPEGTQVYFAAVVCLYCGACPTNCGVPPQSGFCMMGAG
jgi:hypothetical protein